MEDKEEECAGGVGKEAEALRQSTPGFYQSKQVA